MNMSRENFVLPLNLSPEVKLHVVVHNIEHFIWNKKEQVTEIFMMNGTQIKVTQTPEAIISAGAKWGVICELK
jgi:hypothetical protein